MPATVQLIETTTTLGLEVVSVSVIASATPGPAGPGVPVGGTDGQVLTKTSATDYATAWEDPTGGGGASALVDLTDVTGEPPSTGEAPVWDGDSFELTDVATQAELDTHAADTTSIHGIADTTAMALTANHPTNATFNDHSARHENGGADEISIAGLDGTPTELTNHLNDATAAHAASAIGFTPAGGLAADDVQEALQELDTEKTTAAAALTAAQTEIADQKRVVEIIVTDPNGSAITTGDGKAHYVVPNIMNGHNLVDADAAVTTVSSSGTPTIQIRNATQAADMLSTRITIDANENTSYTAATPPVIDTGNDDVATGDIIYVDIDVAGTGAKGLTVILTFEAP